MSDTHALVLEHEGQRLVFRCTYATLLRLAALDDWRAQLADAMGFRDPATFFEVAAIFTGRTTAEIIAMSPPVVDVQRRITGAWSLCMEGPEGLRRYQDAVAKEAAADEGKPRAPANASLAGRFWKTLSGLWLRVFPRQTSGA